VRWFLSDIQPLKGFGFWNPVFIPAAVFIEFIHHDFEFIPVNGASDHIRGPSSGWFIKIPVIEHVAFLQIISGQSFPQIEQPFHDVAPFSNFPKLDRCEFQAGVVINDLGPVFEIGQGRAQKQGVILADTQAVNCHVAVLMPEDLPGFSHIIRMFRTQRTIIGNRIAVNPAHHLFGQMIQIDCRSAAKMVGSPRGCGNIQCQTRRAALIGMQIAHAFDLNQVFKRILANFFRCRDPAFGQNISQPPLSKTDAVHHFNQRIIIAKSQIQTVGVFAGKNTQFIQLHSP